MNIAILGYGKMGKTIENLAINKGYSIIIKINEDNKEEFTLENLKKADVAIEFSRPEAAFENISKCIDAGVPVVSGTTGWLDRLDEVKANCIAKKSAFMYASNFSIGVNIFFAINERLATMMNSHPQYNVTVEEIHHTQKLDAPSGTAISLAQGILKNFDRKSTWVNQTTDATTELPIISKRIDKVPGTHEVSYHSEVDTIEIKHTAHSRLGFASGALAAAEWIVGKEGCFEMRDMLGF